MAERGIIGILTQLWDKSFARVDWELLFSQSGHLYSGLKVTLYISLIAGVIGVALGLGLACLRLSKRWWIWFPAAAYIDAFRCTPLYVQIFFGYHAVPELLGDIQDILGLFPEHSLTQVSALYAGIAVLGLNSGAYLAEVFRGGILSIDKGQREAAISLGMREYQAMGYIVIPQGITNSLPSVGNEFITLIKDSSLLSGISVFELMYYANTIGSREFDFFTMFFGILLIYFCICFPTARLMSRLEKKMRTGQK